MSNEQRVVIPHPEHLDKDGAELEMIGTVTIENGIATIQSTDPFAYFERVSVPWQDIIEIEFTDPADAVLLTAPAYRPQWGSRLDWGVLAALALFIGTLLFLAVSL